MEWIEITASTEHEALDRALDELGVHRDEAEWEVVEVQKARLGGLLGRNEARVRARVKPVSRDKPQTRRDRGGRSGGRGRRGGENRSSKQGDAAKGGRRGGGGNGGTSRPKAERGSGQGRTRGPDAGAESPGDGAPTGAGRRRRGRSGGGGRGARADSPATGGSRKDDARTGKGRGGNNPDGKAGRGRRGGEAVSDGDERDEETVPIDEQAEIAEDFVEGLVDAFEVDADIDVDTDDDDRVVYVSVEGGELGLLVGPGGATISAIEELTRTVLQRRTGGHAARVRVDVGGYKARRREALEKFTHELIDTVKESGRSHELEPMNAADRKTVHGVAAGDDSVTTSSEGEEPRRRVVIHPA
ncbi:MAG: RNA-binding cell elongation regulator Jag/EloR [Acidimicrobiia bacterium]